MKTLVRCLFLGAAFIFTASTSIAAPNSSNPKTSAPNSSKSEHSGDIKGSVQLCSTPIQRGLVYLLGHSFSAKTDSEGKFYLHYVQPGSYKLLVEKEDQIISSIENIAVTKNRVTDIGEHNLCPDNDNDGFDLTNDCNDQNPGVYPGAVEECDNIDNNCDGVVDEGCQTCTDLDLDGFYAQHGCETAVDCNDTDAGINPAASEVCNDGIDNNCDQQIDEDCLSCLPGSSCSTGSVGICSEGTFDNSCTCVANNSSSSEVCDSLDNDCNGQVDEGNVCDTTPVNCVMTDWSNFSPCTEICGGGTSTRVRSVITPASNGGAECGALSEEIACNTQPCPIDCVVSQWSEFSTCSAECGTGIQTRTRSVVVAPQFGGAQCPTLEEVQACNTEECVSGRYVW